MECELTLSLALGRYSVCFLVQQNALYSVHTETRKKRNKTETVVIYHRQKHSDCLYESGLLKSKLKVRVRELNKRERSCWYIAVTKETQPRGTKK